MKVVLLYPDMADVNRIFKTKTVAKLRPQYPLGINYVAAVLQNQGVETIVIDNHCNELANEQVIENVLNHSPDILGFSVTCLNIVNADLIAKSIKDNTPETVIVYGGPQATLLPEEVIKNNLVDYVIVGEGEETFVELIDYLKQNHGTPANIKGLLYRKSGVPHFTGPRPPIEDLDSLPFPHRPKDAIRAYPNEGLSLINSKPVLTVSSSRGCPYNCTFCSSAHYWGRKYRKRNAKNVVDEIEYLVTEHGARGINFREDNFMVDRRKVLEFCDEMIRRKVDVEWLCESRVDNVTPELLEKMYQAGCRGLWCGVESGSQRILDFIKKGFNVEQVETAFKLFKQFKIKAGAGFMFGFPSETIEDVHKTLELAKRIEPDWAYFQVYVGFPRGELYDYIISKGLYDLEWNGVYKVKPDRLSMKELPALEKWLTEEFKKDKKDKWMKSLSPGSRAYVKIIKELEPMLEKMTAVKTCLKAAKDRLRFFPTIKY